ncbi:MAG: hypothetical protein GY842_03280 [bacterium]|nr:hypothetical protein [bacterium]
MLSPLEIAMLFCAAAVVLVVVSVRRGRSRGRLAVVAKRLGLNYAPADTHQVDRRLAGLEMLAQGYHRRISDIVMGSVRLGPIWCFRCRYERGFGSRRVTYDWVVAVLERSREVGAFVFCTPDLPDGRLLERLAQDRASRTPAASPRDSAKAWLAQCGYPAVLEGDGQRVCLATVDRTTSGQYEQLLAAVQQAAECVSAG